MEKTKWIFWPFLQKTEAQKRVEQAPNTTLCSQAQHLLPQQKQKSPGGRSQALSTIPKFT